MKRWRFVSACLAILALIVMLLPVVEADAETSASLFTIENGELIKYKGSEASVTIPKDVTVIGESAFENNTSVEKIVIPDSVEQIKAYAFWGCDNLRSVTLGKGLTSVGDFAFMNCDGITDITIPSNVRSIGIQAFAYCDWLENITIPTNVTYISEDAFDGDYLLNILCEAGSYADKYAQDFYERQKKMAVYGDGTLTADRPVIPSDGVYSGSDYSTGVSPQPWDLPTGETWGSTTVVGNQAVVMMQNSDLPVQSGSATGRPGNADQGTSGISQAVSGTAQVAAVLDTLLPWKIPARAHYRDLDFVTDAPTDIREIGRFAYARSGLKSIRLPDGLETIRFAAFYHCDDLAAVELPESVTRVEAKAFAHTAWVENFLSGSDGTEGDFLISGGVLIAYRGNSDTVVVPDQVRVIAEDVFENHDEIRKLDLPDSVQYEMR
ncbi:MAG: leucine-rich repeat domain-containing protein [Clostridium sp.]|nr:leucine-rich repeat domain-containing protein [Acetatifactor muris]MCM1527846.1 leucine-rich repeat domain-containing protein [Bacteroides sp.]MCM1563346.1 leucine-rich repeat domain-containing protein [Clostridium sp.]